MGERGLPSLSERGRRPGDFKLSALLLVDCRAGLLLGTTEGGGGGLPGAFTT